MTERPIIFSAPMVRAILDGSKTQTRRVVKPRPYVHDSAILLTEMNGRGYYATSATRYKAVPFAVGDVLWAREAQSLRCASSMVFYHVTAGTLLPGSCSRIDLEVTAVRVERLRSISEEDARAEGVIVGKPVPAEIHVTDEHGNTTVGNGVSVDFTARGAFCHLWNGIHGPESWAANPWVWVVSFRRVRP